MYPLHLECSAAASVTYEWKMILFTNKLFTNHSREQKNGKAQSFDCIDFVLAQMEKKKSHDCVGMFCTL